MTTRVIYNKVVKASLTHLLIEGSIWMNVSKPRQVKKGMHRKLPVKEMRRITISHTGAYRWTPTLLCLGAVVISRACQTNLVVIYGASTWSSLVRWRSFFGAKMLVGGTQAYEYFVQGRECIRQFLIHGRNNETCKSNRFTTSSVNCHR